jgi:hypothetical protein
MILLGLIIFIVFVALLGISIATLVFNIQYLGPGFNRTEKIDVKDWRRKWLLFFSWLSLIGIIISIFDFISGRKFMGGKEGKGGNGSSIQSSLLSLVLLTITNIITIMYLGPGFDKSDKIDVNDWRRKWILFFGWFNAVMLSIVVLIFIMYGSIVASYGR